MIKKILIGTSIAIVLFVGIFFGIRFYTEYRIGYTETYVASHQINQRSKICEDDLMKVKVPKDYLKNDVYVDIDDILDKYVKLSYSIPKGSLIYKTALESNIGDLANTLLSNGEVNYDIFTNDVKVNTANINKNMYVDIYLTINDKEKPISDLLLSNARITGLYDYNNKPIFDYDEDSRVSVISLAVSKEDVNIINKAIVVGDISLLVNNSCYDTNLSTVLNVKSQLFSYLN